MIIIINFWRKERGEISEIPRNRVITIYLCTIFHFLLELCKNINKIIRNSYNGKFQF